MIVMKFGGTSVESASAVARVAGIVRERLDRHPIVVVSAMGKTTNRLLQIAETAAHGSQAALSMLGDLRDFHLREAAELGIEAPQEAVASSLGTKIAAAAFRCGAGFREDSLNSNPFGIQAQFKELKELIKALL